MKEICFTLFLTIISFPLIAQQLSLYSQYRENQSIINPAAVSSDFFLYQYNLSFKSTYRSQWAQIEDGPRAFNLKFQYINNKSRGIPLLMGGYVLNERDGVVSTTGIYGQIGALVLANDPSEGALVLGLTGGLVRYGINKDEVRVVDKSNLIALPASTTYPDVGFGIYFYKHFDRGIFGEHHIYAGFSMPRFFGFSKPMVDVTEEFEVERISHYFGMLGVIKHLNEDTFIEPSVHLAYISDENLILDFNLRLQHSNLLWAGVGISTQKTFTIETGALIGNQLGWDSDLKIGYAYSYSLNEIRSYFGDTHEINIAMIIDTKGKYGRRTKRRSIKRF